MNDPLFEPIAIGALELKNRIVMPAMHLDMTMDYTVTDRMVDFYAARARGGAAMICTGFATVDEHSGSMTNIGAHKDEFIPGLTRLAKTIRDNGARAVLQLNHAGRYNISFLMNGKHPVAPSPIASRLTKEEPKELTAEEIQEVIASFARAAARVKEAGFDAVEVLSGTGYLISEFLSPLTNQRTDAYGGDLEKRMRFGLEIMRAIKAATGKDYPLTVRMNGNEFMPGGSTREDLKTYAKRLTAEGVDALCINVGWHEARVPQVQTQVPRAAFAYLARGIKERVDVPVIASHRINKPGIARDLIADGMCDLVAMGRSLVADPELPNKARAGREHEIMHCVACTQGCFDALFKLAPVECLCNPLAGHEADRCIEPASEKKNVLVAGGGPAGMMAAIAAVDRGHSVALYEKSEVLGGQLHLAGAAPGREEFLQLATDLEAQLRGRNIQLNLKREVDRALLEARRPDALILATGAEALSPDIPGADLPHVAQAWDVLAGKVRTGRRVAVVGGGAVGMECAQYLADKGTLPADVLKFLLVHKAEEPQALYELATRGSKEVVLIEMQQKVGADVGKTTKWVLLKELEQSGVRTLVNAKVTAITDTGIKVETPDGPEEIPADSVVLAVGGRSLNPLEAIAKELGIATRVVGDAKSIGKAFDAVHQGFEAGRAV
jgi:2,4-dienoyl-CoA reductase (NADPH2)